MLEQAPFGIAARSEAACLVSEGGDEPSRLYVFNKVLQRLGSRERVYRCTFKELVEQAKPPGCSLNLAAGWRESVLSFAPGRTQALTFFHEKV